MHAWKCVPEIQSIKGSLKDCFQCSYLAGCLCHLGGGSRSSIVMTGWSSAQQIHTVKTGYWCKRSEAAFCRAHTDRATAGAIMCWLGKQPVDQQEIAKLDQKVDASKLFLDISLDLRYTSPRMHCFASKLLAHEKDLQLRQQKRTPAPFSRLTEA